MSNFSKSLKKIKIEYEKVLPDQSNKYFKDNDSSTPANWREVYKNIKLMRKKRDAAVDTMGAKECADETVDPKVSRFQTLVSLMLSSQTKDVVTHAAMLKLRKYGLTVQNILKTDSKTIEELIYPTGFYKRKTSFIKRTCEILKEKYDEDIPPNLEELCLLPGVGKKMAYICMDVAWDKMVGIGVDTHVHRISNRLGWTMKPTKTPEETRKALEDWLPEDHWKDVNILLVGFGQQRCLPIGPKCSTCLNLQFCPFGSSLKSHSPKKLANTKRSAGDDTKLNTKSKIKKKV